MKLMSPLFRIFLVLLVIASAGAIVVAKADEVPGTVEVPVFLSGDGATAVHMLRVIGPSSLVACFADVSVLPRVTCWQATGWDENGFSLLSPFVTKILAKPTSS